MNTQSVSRKTKLTLGLLTILVSLFLLEGIKSTTHNLSGRTFPERLPLLAGLYPNDFLPWGILLFLALGLFVVNFSFRKYGDEKGSYIILSLFGLVTGFMTLLSNKLTYLQGLIWHNEAGQLILVWIVAYWVGIIWTYSYYRLKKRNTFQGQNIHN